MIYAYFGHHKCATRYIISILNEVADILSFSKIEYHNQDQFEHDLKNHLKMNPIDFFYYTNAKYEQVKPILDSNEIRLKGFHLIRDPRDIAVSGYFSHLNSHPTDGWPELIEYRRELKSKNLEEGLLLEIKYNKPRYDDLYHWNYNNNDILEVTYEQMIMNPYKLFHDVMVHFKLMDPEETINLSSIKTRGKFLFGNLFRKFAESLIFERKNLNALRLLSIIYDNDFKRMSKGRTQGEENAHHHYRKGIHGDWKNYFNDTHKNYFKEHYNEILVKLGYEKDTSW